MATGLHKDLPDSELHEAKGAATATTGQVLTADGAGAATFETPTTGPPSPHAATHENGGADEISVTGLSGTLADPQTPTAHASTHENGGADEINVVGLSGELADPQLPKTHAASHSDGGSDEIDAADLGSGAAAVDTVLTADGAGGNTYAVPLPYSDQATATSTTTTTSSTFVLVAGMTLTPPAGTYLVWFSGSVQTSAENGVLLLTIYSGGVAVNSALRILGWEKPNHPQTFCSIAKVTVNGSQAIEGRWLRASGTNTMYMRDLTILRVQ